MRCLPAKDITMMSMCGKSHPQYKIQEVKNGDIVVIKDGEDGVLPLHCCVLLLPKCRHDLYTFLLTTESYAC